MYKKIQENPVLKFLFLAVGIYTLWYILYIFVIQPYTGFDRAVSLNLVDISAWMLRTMGYEVIIYTDEMITFAIEDSMYRPVQIGDPCNGLKLFALFSIFIFAFPGAIKKKLWFIPSGLIAIHLLNALRIAILSIIASKDPTTLDFQHDYTFTISMYCFIFLLWYLWATKLAQLPTNSSKNEQ